jgi:hypothetical protein
MTVSVSRYIKTGTEVEAKYVDPNSDDETRWYQGIVKKINKYGEDDCGKYTECDVLYDDGEFVKNWRFYDEDYGDEVWRFSSHLASLIDALLMRIKELEGEEVEDEELDEDEAVDEDEEENEDEEDDDSEFEENDTVDNLLEIEIRKEQKLDEILKRIRTTSLTQTVTAFVMSLLAVAVLFSNSKPFCVYRVFW